MLDLYLCNIFYVDHNDIQSHTSLLGRNWREPKFLKNGVKQFSKIQNQIAEYFSGLDVSSGGSYFHPPLENNL